MSNTQYSFQISSYDSDKLLMQVSEALEKRTELISRAQLPKMWKMTDMLSGPSQGRKRTLIRSKMMNIICLILGIFLFVPGLVTPQELLLPSLVGAVGIGVGVSGLWRNIRNKKSPFNNSAKILLSKIERNTKDQCVRITFSDEGMITSSEGNEPKTVNYCEFECIIETKDIFLLVFENQALILQKRDLLSNNIENFSNYISAKVSQYVNI